MKKAIVNMKSNLKSYRLFCTECKRIAKAVEGIMDSQDVYLYCPKCHGHVLHKKID